MRTPITLKIKFKSSNLDQFIERYSVDVSRGGIFIRTKEPLPVGTQLRFEFQLQDASALIAGDGTVVWIREHDPARQGVAPGMGVRFDKLAQESQRVLDRILVEKQKRGDAQLESRFDAGARASVSASGTLLARPVGGDFDSSSKITPLPNAVPGLESPGDEFGDESTRVMQNELVQSLADKTRAPEGDKPALAAAATPPKHEEPSVEVAAALDQSDAAKREQAPAEDKPVERPALVLVSDQKTPDKSEERVEASSPPVEESRPATAVTAAPRKRSSAGLYAAVFLVVAGVGYTIIRNRAQSETPPQPVAATETAKPTEPTANATAETPKPVNPAAANPSAANPAAANPAAGNPVGTNTTATATEPGKPSEPTPTTAAANKVSGFTVAVASDPAGATVLVDGTPLPSPTPTTISDLDAKKVYNVSLKLKGFHDWKVKLKPKAGDKVDAALVPNEKVVEIATTPAGAEVTFDGKHVGRTPLTIHKLDLKKAHALEVKRAGFVSQTRAISATDAFEEKGDKDVLAVAMTLEADPKAAAPKPVVKRPVAKKPVEKPDGAKVSEKQPEAAPTETAPAEKPAPEPAAKKPAPEPAAKKPAPEPAKPASDKPTDEKGGIKVPSWMKSKPEDKSAPAN